MVVLDSGVVLCKAGITGEGAIERWFPTAPAAPSTLNVGSRRLESLASGTLERWFPTAPAAPSTPSAIWSLTCSSSLRTSPLSPFVTPATTLRGTGTRRVKQGKRERDNERKRRRAEQQLKNLFAKQVQSLFLIPLMLLLHGFHLHEYSKLYEQNLIMIRNTLVPN
ncbi:hypothetical protein MRB53_003853 [Persea americana]|uniref:Uncharacterized protein n=1 Tax=Persea americana TaxID=3435 RepID=A0ACC2MYK7_PERAE|nr:hypothetical protein MRB53_003853 [Persea americana]